MSERYGSCRGCLGRGAIIFKYCETMEARLREAHAEFVIKSEHGRPVRIECECPQCGETGHSGDAMDYLESQEETEQ